MHGDLSGGNILLTSCTQNPHGFSAKVSDFGLARDLDVLSKIQTKTTGTVTHMAPEVRPGARLIVGHVASLGRASWQIRTG